MHPRNRLLLIMSGLSLPLALIVIDYQCPGPARPPELQELPPLPDGEVTSEQLLDAFWDDPDRARQHWRGGRCVWSLQPTPTCRGTATDRSS
jgi:hypothetical protein